MMELSLASDLKANREKLTQIIFETFKLLRPWPQCFPEPDEPSEQG